MSKKIAESKLIEKFNKLYNELNRVPTREEMGHREPIKRLFGGYNNFVRNMDYLPNFLRTKDDYIKYIKKLYGELGRVPSQNDLIKNGVYALSIYKMFGSYNNLLKLSGFDTREKVYTDKSNEELLSDYIEQCNKLGRWVTTRELESIDIYENRFRSIIEVRKLVVDDNRLNISDRAIKEATFKKYTDEEIKQYTIDALILFSYDITKKEFINYLKEVSGPSVNTIMKRYKVTSFRKMIDMYKD